MDCTRIIKLQTCCICLGELLSDLVANSCGHLYHATWYIPHIASKNGIRTAPTAEHRSILPSSSSMTYRVYSSPVQKNKMMELVHKSIDAGGIIKYEELLVCNISRKVINN